MTELELLQKRLQREQLARKQAETILEEKARELYQSNQALAVLNNSLEKTVELRTEALARAESRLRTLIMNLGAGVLVEDENRKLLLANLEFCSIFQVPIPPEYLVGADCAEAAQQSKSMFLDPEGFIARIESLLEEKEPYFSEALELLDGRILERDYLPIWVDNQYWGHMWKYRDVTDVRETENAIRRSEEKYRGIIENMELGLMEVDTAGIIVRPYPRFCAMVGYQTEELIGQEAIEALLPQEYIAILQRQDADRMEGKAGVYEVELMKKNGERIWVLISGAPIIDHHGEVSGSIGIHYDITRQKKLQIELEEARRRAEEAQEAEKQFLANMSHEIRTPLNAIIGMTHLLYDTQPNPEQLEYLQVLQHSSDLMRRIINDVLDLAKIRSGKFEISARPFDLRGLVQSIVKSVAFRLEGRPLKISIDMDTRFNRMVLGDDLLLNQILHNLIGNAEKFTEKGQIKVKVSLKSADDQRQLVAFCISDTGIGIPLDRQSIIFQSFRQVDGDIKRRYGGTGLGLAITQQLVQLQGGQIWVKSKVGKGSKFYFTIPYERTALPIEEREIYRINVEERPQMDLPVLVVEDNAMNRKYVSALLKKWQVDFQMAVNGKEAVQKTAETPYSLILMDIQMPEMDGYEATIIIRNTAGPNQDTPIIALTASALTAQRDKALKVGMNDYLSKPFKPEQLMQKMKLPVTEKIGEAAKEISYTFDKLFNQQHLWDLYQGDLEYAHQMFGGFLDHTVPGLQSLEKAIQSQNWMETGRLAHKVKPSFSMVGLPEYSDRMEALEHAAKASEAVTVLRLWSALATEMPILVQKVASEHGRLAVFL